MLTFTTMAWTPPYNRVHADMQDTNICIQMLMSDTYDINICKQVLKSKTLDTNICLQMLISKNKNEKLDI